jgi:hypothetical protein
MSDTVPFPPRIEDVLHYRDRERSRWAHFAQGEPHTSPFEALERAYAEIQAMAVELSGGTRDARQRATLYYSIYEDSEGNFMFPLVASHGSMWGVYHTDWIEQGLLPLRALSRHGRVQRWVDAIDQVRDVNRRVFREIYTTFHFTRYFGRHPQADRRIKPPVLALYNRVHEAIAQKKPLSAEERRSIYYEVFVHEQSDIVDPGLKEAAALAGRTLTEATKRVAPRFKYFPRRERLWFSDFTSVEQRNREGLRSLDFAEEVGPMRVLEALRDY